MSAQELDADIKRKIIEILHVCFPVSHIYLYGSRAKRTNTSRSDIDLAIDAGAPVDRYLLGEARSLLDALYMPYKVDLVDLNAVSKNFREIVLREGILWSQSKHE